MPISLAVPLQYTNPLTTQAETCGALAITSLSIDFVLGSAAMVLAAGNMVEGEFSPSSGFADFTAQLTLSTGAIVITNFNVVQLTETQIGSATAILSGVRQALEAVGAQVMNINGVLSGFALSTSSTLVPGMTSGILIAQATEYAPTSAPTISAAPASATSYLFYNSTSGFYWQASAVPANAGDALIGSVTTSATAVTGASSLS